MPKSMKTPPVVSPEAWDAARQQLLVKEKALTRARDALAAERRRMPWMAVEKAYAFDGPAGKVSLIDLFETKEAGVASDGRVLDKPWRHLTRRFGLKAASA